MMKSAIKKTTELKGWLGREVDLSFIRTAARMLPGSEWFLVGGSVRDALLGRDKRKDLDLVVRGVPLDRLSSVLERFGKVNLVGRTFGVLRFTPLGKSGRDAIDFALPRTETPGLSGGYRDVRVMTDPTMPLFDDLSRRDFTVNAMAWDLFGERLIDEHDGQEDLRTGVLRAVGIPERRFAEDLSRILRGLRFAAELGFSIEDETWAAMKSMSSRLNEKYEDGTPVVPAEIIGRELVKSLMANPTRALELLDGSGALTTLLPEVAAMRQCEQTPKYHSEGNVWKHTELAIRALQSPAFAEFFPGESPSPRAVMATLLHDIGKPAAAKIREGRLVFWGHDLISATMTEHIAERLRLSSVADAGIGTAELVGLVRHHMFAHLTDSAEVKRTTLSRYFLDDPVFGRDLLHLAFADMTASIREDGKPDFTALKKLLSTLEELRPQEAAPRLVKGEDVMAVGVSPGPEVGRILEVVREAQLRGEIKTEEEAREFMRRLVG